MSDKGVMLDTSFFIRLLDKTDPLHSNALGYFKYFLENEYELFISTIAIAEYCVKGELTDLPLRNLKILPFNLNHGTKTGEIARFIFQNKNKIALTDRNIIPNDSKLFAQAHIETTVSYYLSSDSESKKIFNLIKQEGINLKFQFIELKNPYHEVFGVLDM